MSLTWSGPGAFIFWHKESTESCCDHLEVYVDGAMQAEWSGENDWAEDTINVTAGTHQIEFRYAKDGTVDTGQDRVWVDDIRSDGAP